MINYQDISPLALEGSGLIFIDGSRIPEPNQGSVNKEKERQHSWERINRVSHRTRALGLKKKKIKPEAGSLLSRSFPFTYFP